MNGDGHVAISECFHGICEFLQIYLGLFTRSLLWTNGIKFDSSYTVGFALLDETQLQIGICSLHKVDVVGFLL